MQWKKKQKKKKQKKKNEKFDLKNTLDTYNTRV